MLLGLAIVFIPMGIIFLITAAGVQEYVFDYTQCMNQAPLNSWAKQGSFEWRQIERPAEFTSSYAERVCQLRFTIPKVMESPVMMYYRLTNYYQNQRLYVRSVNWDQLKGDALPASELGDCDPLVTPDGSSQIYYPCGLIANSMFSDQISDLVTEDGTSYAFPPKDISWACDQSRYGPSKYALDQVRPPPYWTWDATLVNSDGSYKRLPDLQADERFQVWMRVAGLPTFMKPYGKRQSELPAGTYTVTIDSNFEVISYGATKSLVLSTTSWMGGKNTFLGVMYLVIGCVFALLAAVFLAKHLVRPRALGDLNYLSWVRGSSPEA